MAQAHIHQIFYSAETQAMLDPGFIPYNNVGQKPDWAEYWPMRNLLLNQSLDEEAWYGVLSPRFQQKTGLDSAQVLQFIASAPEGTDVLLFPLYFDEASLFENIFIQGAVNHPGIWPVFLETANRLAPGTDLETLVMDSSRVQFCNYFVAKPRFWRHWFSKTEQIFQVAEQGSTAFGTNLNTATHHRNVKGYFFKVFVMERVLSLILATEPQWKVSAYDPFKLPSMRFDIDAELRMLDAIKTALRHTGRPEYRAAYAALREDIFLRKLSTIKNVPPQASITEEIRQLFRNRELQTAPTGPKLTQQQARMLTQQAHQRLHLSILIGLGPGDMAATQTAVAAQMRDADQVLNAMHGAGWVDALRQTPEGWTVLLAPGDVLASDALSLIEHKLAQADHADACVLYFDHDERDGEGHANPYFKPALNQELLLSYPYMGRALVVRNDWALPILEGGGGRTDLVVAYRLALAALRRQAARPGAAAFARLPTLLAHLDPGEPTMFCATSEAWQELAQALAEHVQEASPGAQIIEGPGPGTFHVIHPLPRTPKVSIVIPTRDQLAFLSRCIESLVDNTSYPDFEILIVDNDSQTPEAQAYLTGLAAVDPTRIRVLRAPGPFNFSRMNNMAVAQAHGEFILLLNNDTAALQPDWLAHLMRHALRDGVGIVGARLLYPEGTVQHAGVIMGLRGPADHPCLGQPAAAPGYLFRAQVAQNFSVVTAACLLVPKTVYEEVGGLNEDIFAVSYNDVDFCLRVGQTGRRIAWTPLATLLHEGSASQKASIEDLSQAQKTARFTREQAAMYQRWPAVIADDPAYNPNLSVAERGYEYETNPVLCYDKLAHLHQHRVLAFAADQEGCGHYRVIQPMQAMLKESLCGGGLSPELLSPNMVLRSGADTLVFQRPIHDVALNMLESLLQIKDVRKIFEVDDNLTHLPIKSAHYGHMPRDIRSRITKAIGRCNRLVVSTEALAHEMRDICDDTRVALNRIPAAMWGEQPPPRADKDPQRKPRVGWAGGVGHRGDLEMIAQVIRDLADQVEWVFFGMCPDALRPYVHEVVKGVPTLEYPGKLMALAQSWDLAIAPLEINVFNECKSNLKLLEYGWSGLPVVCSDITPYQGTGPNALPATRVKNRYKDWKDAILAHVNDLDASRKQGLALQQQIAANWTLTGQNLQDWYKAWTD